MTAPLSRLLAVDALPRGERLARGIEDRGGWSPCGRLWPAMVWRLPVPLDAAAIRRHARPLRLARELARVRRAQLFDAWAWEQELSSMHRKERDRADRAERKLVRLREKVWRRDARKNRTRYSEEKICALWWLLESAAFHRGEDERWWPDEHRACMEKAREYRKAMHAAGRGVPGSQPGWEG